MRGMIYRAYGQTPVLDNLPRPLAKRGEVLLRVMTSSVNPVDWKIATGKMWPMRPKLPCIPGMDVAGEIAEVGEGVTGFSPGMHVHGRLPGLQGGASAEYVATTPDVLVPVPETMDFDSAAGLPLAGMTALQALRDHGRMPLQGAQHRVLVVGASGGVGHLALQIARAAGAQVTGVCSGRNAKLVSELGAHEVIDYTNPNAWSGKGPYDLVLDCVGGVASTWTHLLVRGGRYVTVAPEASTFVRMLANPFTTRSVHAVMLKVNAADLRLLDELHAALLLRVHVEQRFPLARLPDAWARSMSGRSAGKLIVRVAG